MGAIWSLIMVHFVVFTLIAAIGFYAWSKLREELAKLDEQEKTAKKAAPRKAEEKRDGVETLKKDPKTGVYRIDED